MKIAVVGTGIAGLAAAWLLGRRHEVTIFEKEKRIGGHANSVRVTVGDENVRVDTGFIVYNEPSYPNLTALFRHLNVETCPTQMSLSVSLDGGRLEYAGNGVRGLFAQPSNVFDPRFLSMLSDVIRFYRHAPRDHVFLDDDVTLGDYLKEKNFGGAFRDDHLLPMASAIWSASTSEILNYPARSFIQFHENHGLLRLSGRPVWRTVVGTSREYLKAFAASLIGQIHTGRKAVEIESGEAGVCVADVNGERTCFDHVVVASHANDAASLIRKSKPSSVELLQAFRYSSNLAVLHSDPSLMPRRRAVWSSWNVIGQPNGNSSPTVTYWMNLLQNLVCKKPLFLTLNPPYEPDNIHYVTQYQHPLFDTKALSAQRLLWSVQGCDRLWFCGSYFGHGFHEDALQSGIAVAEAIDPLCRRPWRVANESARIALKTPAVAIGGLA